MFGVRASHNTSNVVDNNNEHMSVVGATPAQSSFKRARVN